MTKRRAEDDLLCDVPLKRCIRSCRIDAQLPGMAVVCGGNVCNSPSLPALPDNCRKRTYNFEEQEVTRPRKKSTTNNMHGVVEMHVKGSNNSSFNTKNSGSFQEENKAFPVSTLTSHGAVSKKRMRDESIASQDNLLLSEEGTSTEDDLCTFNTFQFWRVPLPDVDLSLLQSDDRAVQSSHPPVKDSAMVSEIDAMET
ncbi:uncharacterized protein wu:fa19b12 [Megalops cyprinoides]|uniref:uncharacterized protein wu:fa19b12 n=1 Tax=Megalops cyprinoides TaxID=118141 RepID=UPI001864C173|nr:uncharacterized protein wu:fa19b12 [Megalops cyprinoides]